MFLRDVLVELKTHLQHISERPTVLRRLVRVLQLAHSLSPVLDVLVDLGILAPQVSSDTSRLLYPIDVLVFLANKRYFEPAEHPCRLALRRLANVSLLDLDGSVIVLRLSLLSDDVVDLGLVDGFNNCPSVVCLIELVVNLLELLQPELVG